MPAATGTTGQILSVNASGDLAFAAAGGSPNLGNTDLMADDTRVFYQDGNSLTFDIQTADFNIVDSDSGLTHFVIGQDLVELGDTAGRVKAHGRLIPEKGIEQDEAGLTSAGAFGAGADITFLGSSNTAVDVGRVYYYSGTAWVGYTTATEAPQKALLGIAVGSTAASGFILKGFINPTGGTGLTAGAPVFGFTNASITSTAPTAGYQRIMGHAISTSVIYFNPSAEYIDLT